MEAIRSPKCSLVSCAVWICSFKTLIWPSNFPLVTSVPAMESFRLLIFSSICAIASSIAAYSLFIFSCCSLVSVRCSLAISKFFPASLRSCSIRSTSKRNILTSYSFSSSFFFKYKYALTIPIIKAYIQVVIPVWQIANTKEEIKITIFWLLNFFKLLTKLYLNKISSNIGPTIPEAKMLRKIFISTITLLPSPIANKSIL